MQGHQPLPWGYSAASAGQPAAQPVAAPVAAPTGPPTTPLASPQPRPAPMAAAPGQVAQPEERPAKRQKAEEEEKEAAAEPPPAIVPPVKPGSKIEVKWSITEDDGSATILWWRAAVEDTPEEGSPGVCQIRYEQMAEFDEEEAEVEFVENGYLRHVDNMDLLRWRFEGDVHDSDDEAAPEADAKESVVTKDEIARDVASNETAAGMSAEQATLQQLSHLPMHQQQLLVEHAQQWGEQFKKKLEQVHQERGPEHAITTEDVKDISNSIQAPQ